MLLSGNVEGEFNDYYWFEFIFDDVISCFDGVKEEVFWI